MTNFRAGARNTSLLMFPSVDKSTSEKHQAQFVVDVLPSLSLRVMINNYRGSGEPSHLPTIPSGRRGLRLRHRAFSRRNLERATDEALAFPFVAATQHSNHCTNVGGRGAAIKTGRSASQWQLTCFRKISATPICRPPLLRPGFPQALMDRSS